jgi:formylglycine-generating enzyme required for sulfatase activity
MRRRTFYLVTITLLFFGANLFVWNVQSQTTLSPSVLTPTPTPITKGTKMKNSIGMEFVRIPSGSFMMGSPTGEAGRNPDEAQRRVTINYEFYIGKYEVTIGEWKRLMGDLPEAMKTGLDARFKKSDKQPVLRVSWNDAKEFIRKLNSQNDRFVYRLPSEAEWEYAARAGTTTPFGIGDGNNVSSSQANFDGDRPYGNASKGKSLGRTTDVGSYQPNKWGIFDMHGNAREWVEDIWQDNYKDLPVDGSANLTRGDSSQRVLRGGSWSDRGDGCRSADHFFSPPANRGTEQGFRLVASRKPVNIKMK